MLRITPLDARRCIAGPSVVASERPTRFRAAAVAGLVRPADGTLITSVDVVRRKSWIGPARIVATAIVTMERDGRMWIDPMDGASFASLSAGADASEHHADAIAEAAQRLLDHLG